MTLHAAFAIAISWQIFRKGIWSESIQNQLPNQFEKCFNSNFYTNRLKINLIQSETLNQINPWSGWSKPNFQFEWFRDSVWFRLKICFRFIRFEVSDRIGFSRIAFWPFFITRDTKRLSDWFGNRFRNVSRNSTDLLGLNSNPIRSPWDFHFYALIWSILSQCIREKNFNSFILLLVIADSRKQNLTVMKKWYQIRIIWLQFFLINHVSYFVSSRILEIKSK